jgi:hypothetical protein
MTASQSYALAASAPTALMGGTAHHTMIAPHPSVRHTEETIHQPTQLDLRTPEGFARLSRMDMIWPVLSAGKRKAYLRDLEIILPPRVLDTAEIALLPGGAVTLRDHGSILVCDPAEAVTFNETETKRLRRSFGARTDVSTLLHSDSGIVPRAGIPKALPVQAVSIVHDAIKSPFRIFCSGPVLIQWGVRGAVAWPLVEAPAAFALAGSIAACPLTNRGTGLVSKGSALTPETWYAANADDRCKLISPVLADHIDDLLGGTISDDLLRAVTNVCLEGPDCLAMRTAEGLAMLPSCFQQDPASIPGAPADWRIGTAYLQDSTGNFALLGVDDVSNPFTTIRALRDAIEDGEVLAFGENGDALADRAVPLHSDAALFVARKAGARGRLGIVVRSPASPVDLYVQAHEVACSTGTRITAIAPCWGFCHRVGPDGVEAGNAGWYGMGAGLDEVDSLIGDFEFGA